MVAKGSGGVGVQFELKWADPARSTYQRLRNDAKDAAANRIKTKKTKASKQEGLFKQVKKTIELLKANPRHTGLHTHEYSSMPNPVRPGEKVWEAYAQNKTPGAYRVFWVYGPGQNEITILAITPHP